MGVLDLYLLLFPRAAHRQRSHVGFHWRSEIRVSGYEQAISLLGIAGSAGGCGDHEPDRSEHRQMAAERRGRCHICSVADACGHRGVPGTTPRERYALLLENLSA